MKIKNFIQVITGLSFVLAACVSPVVVNPAPVDAESSTWQWVSPLPQGNHLNGVWGNSGSDVFAVGDHGTIIHYNGTSWSVMDSGTTNALQEVWGSSPSDVYAVGRTATIAGYMLHYDGNNWTPVTLPPGTQRLLGIWGSSGSDIFACGELGTIIHYDGTSWTAMNSGVGTPVTDIWGISGNDVYASCAFPSVLHYDGNPGGNWTTVFTSFTQFYGIWGSSDSDIFAVGGSDKIVHYNGQAWENQSSGVLVGIIWSVWGSSSVDAQGKANDVYAVHSSWGPGGILHYNGTSWSNVEGIPQLMLRDIWGSSATDIFAVGYYGIIYHFDGINWSRMDICVTDSILNDIWGSGWNDVFAVGLGVLKSGEIIHYNGTSWNNMPLPNDSTLWYEFGGVWGSSGNDVFAVGQKIDLLSGTGGLILHYDGTGWTEMVLPEGVQGILDVWGSSGSNVLACGENVAFETVVLRYDGTTWTSMPLPEGINNLITCIWGTSAENVFAAGNDGLILRYDGNSWNIMSTSVYGDLSGIWGSSASDIYITGRNLDYEGIILHYDGNPNGAWSLVNTYPDIEIRDIHGSSAGNIFVVGIGDIVHYDGTSWTVMENLTDSLNAVWTGCDDGAFAVGLLGRILQYGDGCPVLHPSQSVETATGTGIATFTTSNGSIIGLSASISTPCGASNGSVFPHGFFSFNITSIPVGSTVTITIVLPLNIAPSAQYWKCVNGQWVDVTSLLGDNDGDNVLTLTLTDGGPGDGDGVANGIIVDPGGPALVRQALKRLFLDDNVSPVISNPAHIRVKNINVLQTNVTINQQVVLYANVVNSGDVPGTFTTNLIVNGKIEQTKPVTVNANSAKQVQFTILKDQPGNYNVEVNGQKAYFIVVDSSNEVGAVTPRTFVLIGLIVCAMGVLIVSLLLVLRRRRVW